MVLPNITRSNQNVPKANRCYVVLDKILQWYITQLNNTIWRILIQWYYFWVTNILHSMHLRHQQYAMHICNGNDIHVNYKNMYLKRLSVTKVKKSTLCLIMVAILILGFRMKSYHLTVVRNWIVLQNPWKKCY